MYLRNTPTPQVMVSSSVYQLLKYIIWMISGNVNCHAPKGKDISRSHISWTS